MLRKLAVWLLLIPMPLNGLWLVCRDAPPATRQGVRASANEDENLFSEYADLQGDDLNSYGRNASLPVSANCSRECAIRSGARPGSACFFTEDGSTSSMTIVIFGLAPIPAQIELQPATTAGQPAPELADLYANPCLARSSPPPRV